MGITDLKMKRITNKPIYYGFNKVKIIEIYETFNLVDVAYEAGGEVFTIDFMTLRDSPSTDIWIKTI